MTTTRAPVRVRRPVVARTGAELSAALAQVRANRGRVGLVPTMGALHEGHRSLIQTARELVDKEPARELVDQQDAVVVSIFVNPMQFGPDEDLERYPRSFESDVALCSDEGVDVVFAPDVAEVYPRADARVSIEPGPLAGILEGDTRPGHFRGVLTVVAKLFGLVRPDLAVFGQKDYQQLVLIRAMAEDLAMGVEIVGAETMREADGLALSSRNRYLDDAQRLLAATISRALRAGVEAGRHGAAGALAASRDVLEDAVGEGGVVVDYLALTSPSLGTAPERGEARLLVAARVGTTRLIDNTSLVLGQ